MINITSYVKKFGNKTFSQMKFNYVDSLIMAQLAYVNWELVLPLENCKNDSHIILKNVPDGINKELNAGEFDSKRSEKLILEMKKSKRFKNINIRLINKIDDIEKIQQFFALTITLPTGLNVISFRGTDLTLTGWKEDCALALVEEIPSQNAAVNYANEVMSKLDGDFVFVGHSKGGNLSYYAGIKIKKEYQDRLINAFSFDGPGFFSERTYDGDDYKAVEHKLIKFVPKDSIVGTMLNTTTETYIVSSSNIAVFQHDPFSWKINENADFIYCKKRTVISKLNEQMLVEFLAGLDNEKREEVINCLFQLLGNPDASLIDLAKHAPKTAIHFVRTYFKYPKEKKEMLLKTIGQFINAYRKTAVKMVKAKVDAEKVKLIENKALLREKIAKIK